MRGSDMRGSTVMRKLIKGTFAVAERGHAVSCEL